MEKEVCQNDSLSGQACIDPLTGLFNRLYACDVLRRLETCYGIGDGDFTILILDLDNFENVNETSGFAAGDRVLCEISGLLKARLRPEDIVSRWGGGAFMIILPGTYVVEALAIANELQDFIRNWLFDFDGASVRLTFSGGIEQYGRNISIDQLIRSAEKALSHAKARGKNQLILYSLIPNEISHSHSE